MPLPRNCQARGSAARPVNFPLMRFALVAALFALAAVPLGARAEDAAQTAALREDLHVLANAIRTKHPAPFHAVDAASFDREVAELDGRLPTLTKDRALLEFQRIVASVGDGHTSLRLFAMHGAAGAFTTYPVRFYRFTDGWFVRFADDRYAAIRGGRIVSIAGLSPDALAERLAPYVSRDNEMTIRDRVPFLMGSPKDEEGRYDDEGPQHEVEITKPFYLGVYAVTQGQWRAVMGNNPSHFCAVGGGKEKVQGLDTRRFPVESVS